MDLRTNILILSTLLYTMTSFSQDLNSFPTAEESDPIKMGWMQGFPPPKDKILRASDGSFFEFPALRWSVVNMRQFLPTINVSRGLEAVSTFEYNLDKSIDNLKFNPTNGDAPMSWKESLSKNYTDGIIVLHNGKVVYEDYFGALTENKQHAIMSLTKSFTGTLASILVAEGTLDPSKLVSHYVPELKNSAFGDATVRQLMDMTTGLQYSEDYADSNAEVWTFSAAGNPMVGVGDESAPVGYYAFLETVQKQGEHGEAFGYKTINTDALGWVIARASGKSVNQLLEDKIWSKLGMEQDAYYQVDALGTAFAGGGMSASLRDLARFAEMIRNKGQWKGEQIIPDAAVEDIQKGGDQLAFFKAGYDQLKNWSYRNMWWITENENSAFTGRGVHGQAIYIDPTAEMVIVRLASHPIAANGANDPYSLPAYQAVADYLMTKN